MLVTGASFGIGEQVARIEGAAGAQVLLMARTRSRLEEVAAGIEADGGEPTLATLRPCGWRSSTGEDRNWRRDHNQSRPHPALGWLTPAEYAGRKLALCPDEQPRDRQDNAGHQL